MYRYQRLLFLAITALFAGSMTAQTTPSISVTNNNDLWLEIIPLDGTHQSQIPSSLNAAVPSLPAGSFILKNQTTTAITVIVAKWSYIDKSGQSQLRNIYCDGYLVSPVHAQVNPNDLSLVTPDGCTRQEFFARLTTDKFFGSPIDSQLNREIVSRKDSIAAVQISIDSVVFADGRIWGPDMLHYYTMLMDRYVAAQSVAGEISAAKNSGEDTSVHLERIQSDAWSKKSKNSALRAYYANLIQKSPNPEGTLQWLQQESPLPEFHHIGEQK